MRQEGAPADDVPWSRPAGVDIAPPWCWRVTTLADLGRPSPARAGPGRGPRGPEAEGYLRLLARGI
jgi:hypothetical protein